MKNLQLSLKRKWFEMTKSGIKTEDYRDINFYWFKRLVENADDIYSALIGSRPNESDLERRNKCTYSIVTSQLFKEMYLKKFNINIMTLGYPKSTNIDRILNIEHKGIEIRTGNPEWGADPNKLYFVILHGEILNK